MTRRAGKTVTGKVAKTHRGTRNIWKDVDRRTGQDDKWGRLRVTAEHAEHADGHGDGSGSASSGATAGAGLNGADDVGKGHGHSPPVGYAAATSPHTVARGDTVLDTPADADHLPRKPKPDGSPTYRFTEEPPKQHKPNQ